MLLRAARFTTGYVRLVGQEPLLLASVCRREDEGDRWTVKLDVLDLGGHLDATFRGWSATLASRVRLVIFTSGASLRSSARFSWEAWGYSVHVYSWCSAWNRGLLSCGE